MNLRPHNVRPFRGTLRPPTTVQTWVDATRVQHRVQAFEEQGSATPGFFGSVLHKEPTLTVRSRIDAATPAWAEDRYVVTDLVVTLYSNNSVDLDIDSDRNNGLAPPDHSNVEDLSEDTADNPGKIVAMNDDDRDGDFVPDFVDGFDAFEDLDNNGNPMPGPDVTPPNATQNGGFVPVVLRVPPGVDLTQAAFQVEYDASDPACVSRTGAGTIAEPFSYTVPDGLARLWTKDGTSVRKAASLRDEVPGDFVEPVSGSDFYGPECWSKLDITSSNREKVLFLEGIAPSTASGDLSITFRIDPDGEANGLNFTLADTVRATVVDVDVLIGANTADDESLCDDWVAAKDTATGRVHRIYNWLRMTAPAGVEQMLTLEAATTASGGTVSFSGFAVDSTTILQDKVQRLVRTVGSETGSVDAVPFLVNGDRVSSKMDDARVNVALLADNCAAQAGRFEPQLFGTETLTVMKFAYEPEVASEAKPPPVGASLRGNMILNPAVRYGSQIIAFDIGNLSAAADSEDRHRADLAQGTLPVLNVGQAMTVQGRKFDVSTIEVLLGREIETNGQVVGRDSLCTDGTTTFGGLRVAVAGENGLLRRSNLRFEDSTDIGTGTNASLYTYTLGHPTQQMVPLVPVWQHPVVLTAVPTKLALANTVNVTLVEFQPAAGALETTQLDDGDVQQLIDEASRVWEQVGVSLVKGSVQTVRVTSTAQWNLPNDDAATLTGVTTLRRAPGIDVFIVNSLCVGGNTYASGLAAFSDLWGIGDQETGVVLARRMVGPSSGFESPGKMARTLAHEIGHLIHNEGQHDPRSWNLMRPGEVGSTWNSDLTINYRDAIGIGPSTYDNDENW